MKRVHRAVGWLVVVAAAAAVLGLGCSGDSEAERAAATAAAVADAESVAESALLTVGDLPAGDWGVEEIDLLEVDSYVPDPADWPEECGEEPDWPGWDEEGVLVARGRGFRVGESSDGIFSTMVMVFESVEKLERVTERREEDAERERGEECATALEAREAARGSESREEEPRYGLPGETGSRRTSTSMSSGITIESHWFVRGRVMAFYMIIDSDKSPRGVDHQALLEAFEARVVAAQE